LELQRALRQVGVEALAAFLGLIFEKVATKTEPCAVRASKSKSGKKCSKM